MKSKKAIFFTFLIITILSCSGLSAQLNLSITGGGNYSKFNSILLGKDYYRQFNSFYKFQVFANLGFELSYQKKDLIVLTGLSYSYRGSRDYFVPTSIFKKGYIIDFNGYLEIPVLVSYAFYNNRLNSGFGLIFHTRIHNDSNYYSERNKFYGLDLRISSCWNINSYLSLVPSYTLGNLDKYISNTYGNFLHHVFALNLRYTFLHYQFKAARQHKPVRQNR